MTSDGFPSAASSNGQVGAAVRPTPAPHASWRFVVLAEIQNFAALRRHVGKSRADQLVADVAARAAQAVTAVTIVPIGRTTLEIELLGDGLGDVDASLDAIAEAFARPLDIDGEDYVVELTLAAAAAPIGAIEEVGLAEAAEEALLEAHAQGRRIVREASRQAPTINKLSLRRELARAIECDEMFLQYQPKVHVRQRVVASAEALVRWDHPTRGLILPNDFIPFAEESQLIGPLTLWTLRRVIADQRVLAAEGQDLTIFINISGQLLGDVRFIQTACAMIADSGVKIGFEITETSMIRDPALAITHLRIIADHGVPIAIDDYGAGLSSLAYLKQLPAKELKIDKMFVLELTSSNRDPLIVRSTIDLAHAMEMEVVAEGVETPAALALLTVMGCDLVQGFLLSRPLSFGAFRQYLVHEAKQLFAENGAAFPRPPAFWRVA